MDMFSSEPSTSDGSFTTEPCSSSSTSSSSGNFTSCRSKIFGRFSVAPQIFLNGDIKYPGGIPFPFPLEEKYIAVLKKPRIDFASPSNYSAFIRIVQRVYEVIITYLLRKPTKHERKEISKNLCIEYPILQCGSRQSQALEEVLRKRANNVNLRSNKMLKVTKKICPLKKSESPDLKKKRLQDISGMTGEKITLKVLKQYPMYKEAHVVNILTFIICSIIGKVKLVFVSQCIEDLAFLKKRNATTLEKTARERWDIFVEIAKKKIETEHPHPMIEISSILSNIFGSAIINNYVLKICSDGQIFSESCNQPYILCTNCYDGSKNISIISDKITFASTCLNNEKSYFPFLLLLSTYYVMNLAYPPQAQACFSAIEFVLTDDQDTDHCFEYYRDQINKACSDQVNK